MQIYLIMHDIRSAHNVGSLFRTASTFDVAKIYISGYTPAPLDRFGRKDSRIAKVSLGAEEMVPWERANITELMKELRKESVPVVALEQSPRSTPLAEYQPPARLALILGNEVEGVSADILALADTVLEIPLQGKLVRNRPGDSFGKESLNVSVAGAIALYALRTQ